MPIVSYVKHLMLKKNKKINKKQQKQNSTLHLL